MVLTLTKERALAEFLGVEENEVKENSWGTYSTISSDEYLVLTDDEANEEVYKAIENSLWAFNAEFIIDNHVVIYFSSIRISLLIV